jgi:hypothetical protein
VYLESATETEVPALYRRQKADLLDTAAKEEQRIKVGGGRRQAPAHPDLSSQCLQAEQPCMQQVLVEHLF